MTNLSGDGLSTSLSGAVTARSNSFAIASGASSLADSNASATARRLAEGVHHSCLSCRGQNFALEVRPGACPHAALEIGP